MLRQRKQHITFYPSVKLNSVYAFQTKIFLKIEHKAPQISKCIISINSRDFVLFDILIRISSTGSLASDL